MSNQVEIGKAIVSTRKSRGISQEKLALKANVSVSYLRDIEHDCANPTIDKLESIAAALDLSLPALMIFSLTKEQIGDVLEELRER